MNSMLFKYSGILLVLAACALFLGSCTIYRLQPPAPTLGHSAIAGPPPWAPAHGHRAKHTYYYFHDSQVYIDFCTGMYFFHRDGRWRTSAVLPTGIILNMKSYVILAMDGRAPYRHHKDVMKRYPPGQLKKASKKKKRY